MPKYKAPLDDMRFILNEVLNMGQLSKFDGYDMVDTDTINQMLDAGAKISEEVMSPLNQSGDKEGCVFNPQDNSVKTPEGFKEAYQTFIEGGWPLMSCDPEYGGMGMPLALDAALKEMFCSANLSFGMYPGLSHGVYNALHEYGSDDLKNQYLEKLVTGEWTGTMCLTESGCGTDLGLMKTKAKPQDDGSYKVSGEKIFISAGEHDLAGNIVHLVLAKIDDKDLPEDQKTPDGIKGVSLFLVPKYMPDEKGEAGKRNDAKCVGIEEKMGIHANSTCTMQFEGAKGYLIGDAHKGMRAMFVMMNEARLGVAMQGLGLTEMSYQGALDYAKERVQGRSMTGRKAENSTDAADPLTVIPDVRRMLMTMKAVSEGERMLAYWVGMQLDISHKHPDEKERKAAEDMVALMTPIIKAHFTDNATDTANMGMQIFGGHGFIEESGMAQYVRDARITQIYEGANGVQALDLIGRKVMQKNYIGSYLKILNNDLKSAKKHSNLKSMSKQLDKAVSKLKRRNLLLKFNAATKRQEIGDILGAASVDYLRMVSTITMAHMMIKMADTAQQHLNQGAGDHKEFYETKIKTAEFYIEKILPQVYGLDKTIATGHKTLFSIDDSQLAHTSSNVAIDTPSVNDNKPAKETKSLSFFKRWKK